MHYFHRCGLMDGQCVAAPARSCIASESLAIADQRHFVLSPQSWAIAASLCRCTPPVTQQIWIGLALPYSRRLSDMLDWSTQ